MDFGKNLSTIRKKRGLSQEELADMLNVSRQTIYKWETDVTAPDVNKLVELASALDVKTDALLSDTYEATNVDENKPIMDKSLTAKAYTLCSHIIGWSVCTILLGVAVCIILNTLRLKYFHVIGLAVMFSLIFAAVLGFIFSEIKLEHVKKAATKPLQFTTEEQSTCQKRFVIMLCNGFALIFIGIIETVILSSINKKYSPYAVSALLFLVGVGVALIIIGGMTNTLYSAPQEALAEEKKDKLVESISGVIMTSATIVFLVLGFIADKWHPSWIAFPIGGILCGLTERIIGLIRRRGQNNDANEQNDLEN